MWELVATAVAGLNAGAGLQAAIAGAPSNSADGTDFARVARRTRVLGLLLTTVSTGSCFAAHYGENRGALWLAAAAGVAIGIPFNLLLMNPPTAVMTAGTPYAPSPRVRFAETAAAAQEEAAAEAAAAAGGDGNSGGEGAGVSAFEGAPAPPMERGSVLSAATVAPSGGSKRRLLYSKSGMLVSAADLSSSWSKRCWFSAALSLTAFGCMMALVGTGKDAATYGYAPY